jgi:hypothetical protein
MIAAAACSDSTASRVHGHCPHMSCKNAWMAFPSVVARWPPLRDESTGVESGRRPSGLGVRAGCCVGGSRETTMRHPLYQRLRSIERSGGRIYEKAVLLRPPRQCARGRGNAGAHQCKQCRAAAAAAQSLPMHSPGCQLICGPACCSPCACWTTTGRGPAPAGPRPRSPPPAP